VNPARIQPQDIRGDGLSRGGEPWGWKRGRQEQPLARTGSHPSPYCTVTELRIIKFRTVARNMPMRLLALVVATAASAHAFNSCLVPPPPFAPAQHRFPFPGSDRAILPPQDSLGALSSTSLTNRWRQRCFPERLRGAGRVRMATNEGPAAPKYLWGTEDTFPMSWFVGSFVYASVIVGLALAFTPMSGPGLDFGMRLPELGGAVLSTCTYFWIYYNILGTQVSYRLKNNGGSEAGLRATTRGTGNTVEQMGPFLVTLWMYAAYVDAATAGVLGMIYAVSRALYVPLWAYYGAFTVLVEFSTSPSYAVIYTFIAGLVCKVLLGSGVVELAGGLPLPLWLSLPTGALVLQLGCLSVGWLYPLGAPTADLLGRTCPGPEEGGEE